MISILKLKKFTISLDRQNSILAGSIINLLHFLTGTSVWYPEKTQLMRVRDIGRQIYCEKKVDIVSGAQWSDYVRIFFFWPQQCYDFRSGVQGKVPFPPISITCVPTYLKAHLGF